MQSELRSTPLDDDDGPAQPAPTATQKPGAVPDDKANLAILKKMTFLIINNIKLDIFTIILMTTCIPPTRIETLKYISH